MSVFLVTLLALQTISAQGAQDWGTFRFDCATAGEACQNACYYMYCANPQPGGHTFYDGGNDPSNTLRDINRYQSGDMVSGGPPCRVLPFSQKLYDAYPFWNLINPNHALETDEFPLASWWQNDFQPNTWPPRNTLRCIPRSHNKDAGRQYQHFRQGVGPWGPNSQDPRAAERRGPNSGRGKTFSRGDWFQVAFMGVDDNLMPACRQAPDCRDRSPARQFHMSNKRNINNNNALNRPGLIKWPYDPTQQNTYEMTDPWARAANRPIRMFQMSIRRGGPHGDTYAVRIYAYSQATGWRQVSRGNNEVGGPWIKQTNGPFTVAANPGGTNLGLPLGVTIDGSDDPYNFCGKLVINYGNPGTDGAHFYAFDTGASGYSAQINSQEVRVWLPDLTNFWIEIGPYCTGSTPRDAQGRPEREVREWICYFPGS